MIDIRKLTSLATQPAVGGPCAEALAAVSKAAPAAWQARSFVPPPPRHADDRHFDLVAASLAGGMIAATGREHTAAEAVGVFQTVRVGLVHEPHGGSANLPTQPKAAEQG